MANLPAERWADVVQLVEQNFRTLFEKALEWPVANDEAQDDHDDYHVRKTQMLNSLLFYTTRILLDGVTVEMRYGPVRRVGEAVEKIKTLQQELVRAQPGEDPLKFETFCNNFKREKLSCPTPLVLLLKMAVDGKHCNNIQDIETFLGTLGLEGHPSDKVRYFPGVPACVLGCQQGSGDDREPRITSTKDRFDELGALQNASGDLWTGQLERLKELCSDGNKTCMNDLEGLSTDFVRKCQGGAWRPGMDVETRSPRFVDFLERHSNHATRKRLVLTEHDDILATWKPNGTYYESCLLDYYRFNINRPPDNKTPSRKVWRPATCAEWFFFVEMASLGTNFATEALPKFLGFADEQGGDVQQERAMQSQERAQQELASQQESPLRERPPIQQRRGGRPGQQEEGGAQTEREKSRRGRASRGGSGRGRISRGSRSTP